MTQSFSPTALRQLLAQRGIHPDRDPADFPASASAEILGMTPTALGYDQCAHTLARLRAAAEAATGGDYAIRVTRDPATGQRTGYGVWTRTRVTANQIAHQIAAGRPRLVVR